MTTSELSDADVLERLDVEHIRQAAEWVANRFTAGFLSARVNLTPGDMTCYAVVVTAPQLVWPDGENHEYIVALVNNGGGTYPWAGETVHPGYATQKWGITRWTGVVTAAFLNALAECLGAT